jgi:opacity protein-like surface antigen
MQELSRIEPRRGRIALLALVGLLAVTALALAARPAGAAAPSTNPTTCPGFRVLHNDRIGAAVFPAGSYTLTLQDTTLNCKSSAELFARFLEDYDGVLPLPWTVANEGSGKAAFLRNGTSPGFAVELTAKQEGGTNPDLGKLCPGTFTVNSTTVVGPLRFTKGKFLIYLPAGSGITCNRASVLFTRFLGAGGALSAPWKVINQTATFYKPQNPKRSAFRIEPLNGSGRR